MRSPKKYNTMYKKKVDVWRDTYLPRRSPKEVIQNRLVGISTYTDLLREFVGREGPQ